MKIHLIDGTYELFRHFYALPSSRDADGREVAAVRGVLQSILGMIRSGTATHVGVATDHVIESFRNRLWRGYKTSEGVPRVLLDQFQLLEDALRAMGVVVWPMVEFEADDALAAAAAKAADSRVEQVVICTPDKDLAQCVRGTRVVQLNRRTREQFDEAGIIRKFGVKPESIPDYLALVGDSSDGYPGLPGWGAKSSAAVLAKFVHLEHIPPDWRDWHANATNAAKLAETLSRDRDKAMLFRTLATLRTDVPTFTHVDELRWTGPRPEFEPLVARLENGKR
ncbi:MAG TPA: 5'-3' exonuclease H3TH domain-containing protein [Vicinamibacterales bacterium]|nr:5'-3' exonuclease H3TH domain-containing protein [Vicinamibacterales bacterium]